MTRRQKYNYTAVPVAEGVRVSYGNATAFAVRRENKDISLRIRRERRPLRQALGSIPFVRGMQRLWLSMHALLDGISESSELEPQRIVKGTGFEQALAGLFGVHSEGLVAFVSAILICVILAATLCGLPMAVETWVLPNFELTRGWINAAMCFSRILGALLGLFLCARLRVVNRLCMYRGAVNKVFNAYESGHREPDLDDALEASRYYHKSDMAFLTVVLALSIVAFALIRTFTLPIQLLVRALTVLAVAAVVNEPIQALERLRPSNPVSRLLVPYLWLERLYVLEPHSQMVEVAVCAFNAARENNY